VGVSAWVFWDPGELTLYFRPWRGIKKRGAMVSSDYFLLRMDGAMSLGQIGNSSKVLNWSCIVVFSWRKQRGVGLFILSAGPSGRFLHWQRWIHEELEIYVLYLLRYKLRESIYYARSE
jgi:hypothetical protein